MLLLKSLKIIGGMKNNLMEHSKYITKHLIQEFFMAQMNCHELIWQNKEKLQICLTVKTIINFGS